MFEWNTISKALLAAIQKCNSVSVQIVANMQDSVHRAEMVAEKWPTVRIAQPMHGRADVCSAANGQFRRTAVQPELLWRKEVVARTAREMAWHGLLGM